MMKLKVLNRLFRGINISRTDGTGYAEYGACRLAGAGNEWAIASAAV